MLKIKNDKKYNYYYIIEDLRNVNHPNSSNFFFRLYETKADIKRNLSFRENF
jgi:hypothetical protein